MTAVRARLPELYCPECCHQLVSLLFTRPARGDLLCLFCARDLPAAEIRSVTPDAAGMLPGVTALDRADAVALLNRYGTEWTGGDQSRH